MPTLKELWDEQSTPVRVTDGGRQEERKLDVETEIWDNGEWTRARRLVRHPQKEDTEMVFMRTKDSHFLIGQDNHPSMLSESQSKCPECNRTLRFTSSGKTRFCRNGHVSGISVEDTPKAEETRPRDIEDRSHLAHIDDVIEGADAKPPVSDGWVTGMFASEGAVRHVKEKCQRKDGSVTVNEHPRSVMWCQTEGPVRDRLEKKVSREHSEKHGAYHCNSAGGDTVVIDSTELAETYEVFGRGSENKGLPGDFIGYSDEWLASFLAGVLDGDGTEKHTQRGSAITLDTTSPLLVQQVLTISRRLEIWATVSLTPNRELTRTQGFRVHFENAPPLREVIKRTTRFEDFELKEEETSRPNEPNLIDYVRSVYPEEETPVVYGVETESHTLTANGIWTHNTDSA
jgi:hypothetical protein